MSDKQEPGILRKGYNFLTAMAKYAASGFTDVPPEIFKERLETCEKCEELNQANGHCFKCGCPVEARARIAVMSCPLNKWLARDKDGKPIQPLPGARPSGLHSLLPTITEAP